MNEIMDSGLVLKIEELLNNARKFVSNTVIQHY